MQAQRGHTSHIGVEKTLPRGGMTWTEDKEIYDREVSYENISGMLDAFRTLHGKVATITDRSEVVEIVVVQVQVGHRLWQATGHHVTLFAAQFGTLTSPPSEIESADRYNY